MSAFLEHSKGESYLHRPLAITLSRQIILSHSCSRLALSVCADQQNDRVNSLSVKHGLLISPDHPIRYQAGW